MTPLRRIAVIGNSLPRRCGIATFTTDLQRAISTSRPNLETCIVAMTDHGQAYDYPASVALQIKDDSIEEYVRAADFLNAGRFDIVCLQHEFGIFGGEAGAHILELLSRLTMPVVTTLHTVLAKPTAAQRAVMERIVEASSKVVVMANKGRELLRSVYQVPDDKIEVIAHGIPDFPFVAPDAAKAKLGFSGRSVILTFGLLSPNKGIEVMIDAMPSILKRRAGCGLCRARRDASQSGSGPGRGLSREPDGARARTWRRRPRRIPRPVRRSGHAARIHLDVRRLCHALSQRGADDVGNAGLQLRAGQAGRLDALLARARTAGRWTRRSGSLWRRGGDRQRNRGIAHRRPSPAGDARARLCGQPNDDMGAHRRALHVRLRECAAGSLAQGHCALRPVAIAPHSPAAPDMQIGHFLSMCDDTGLFQHAVHSVPDRSHGYCVDDNARALLLACALNNPGEQPPVGSFDGPLCRFRAACVESRHQAISQLHGLQSNLA